MILEGFKLTISTGDVVVEDGRLGDLQVDTQTVDVSAAALGDGDHLIVMDSAGTATAQLSTYAFVAGDVCLGGFTEATAAATALTYAGREVKSVASA